MFKAIDAESLIAIFFLTNGSAVVEARFLCWHAGSNFIPTGDNCRQNNGQEINAVMFRPKSKLRVTRWIIGTGRVNSGKLSIVHATALAWQGTFRKQSSLFEGLFYLYIYFFFMYPFFFKIVHFDVDKTESLRHVFSKNCCFVANLVDEALVNDSTNWYIVGVMYNYTQLHNLSVESQKGAITIQRCSIENQKGAITIDFVQR